MLVRVKCGDRLLLKPVADVLMLAGMAGVLVFAWAWLDGAFYQYTQKVQFITEVADGNHGIAKEVSLPEIRPQPDITSPLVPNLSKLLGRDPFLIGKLDVPRIGLSVMVREGVDTATLRRAAGHVPSTALPGELGNVVLLGHRDTYFRQLRGLREGDAVRISTTRGGFTYVVESIQVLEPEGIVLTAPSSEAVATLITCFPFNYVGPSPRRFVAQARLRDRF